MVLSERLTWSRPQAASMSFTRMGDREGLQGAHAFTVVAGVLSQTPLERRSYSPNGWQSSHMSVFTKVPLCSLRLVFRSLTSLSGPIILHPRDIYLS